MFVNGFGKSPVSAGCCHPIMLNRLSNLESIVLPSSICIPAVTCNDVNST